MKKKLRSQLANKFLFASFVDGLENNSIPNTNQSTTELFYTYFPYSDNESGSKIECCNITEYNIYNKE